MDANLRTAVPLPLVAASLKENRGERPTDRLIVLVWKKSTRDPNYPPTTFSRGFSILLTALTPALSGDSIRWA